MSLADEFSQAWRAADGWKKKVALIAMLPLVLFVAMSMPPAYDCPSCGTELRGEGDNCPECGHAFTEKGHLKNIEQEVLEE